MILAITTQPLQAGCCAMEIDQGRSADMEMPMGMDHSDDHGCCDPQNSDSEEACENGSHCGFCTAVTPLTPSSVRLADVWIHVYSIEADVGDLLPSHASPPFRPPIS
jgi:hypothetical protein